MVRVLKRCRSTIFRELKRNHFSDPCMPKCDGYYGAAAQLRTANRRARERKLIRHPDLLARVIERLKNGWTPEQISNRMQHKVARLRVCQETIYRYYSREGIRDDLRWYLPNHCSARRPRHARKRLPPRFHRDVSILFRPDDLAHRRQFVHWKGDLVLFKQSFGQSNVTSLVECVSRFALLLKTPSRHKMPVMVKIVAAIRDLPYPAQKSITLDRGTEFVSRPHPQAEIGTHTWFCDPSSRWQKGTVENTNRRAGRWLPRTFDIRKLSDHEIKVKGFCGCRP